MQRISIYCHTNKVNGKRYVGQTVGTMEKRWAEHVLAAHQEKGCPLLGAAIRKYGAGVFTHDLLDVVTTQNGANIAEKVWIKQKGSRAPRGYNLSSGGYGLGRHHEVSKRLMRERKMSLPAERRKENATKASMASLRAREQNGPHKYVPRSTEECNRIVKKAWETRRSHGYKVSPEQGKKAWATRQARYGETGVRSTPKQPTSEQRTERTRKAWITRRLNKLPK